MLGASGPLVSGTWWNLTGRSALAPAPRTGMATVYDPVDGYVLLFGGANATISFGDTWSYANGAWTQLFPTASPSPRYWAGIAWDAVDGYAVLFGGAHNATSFMSDTWSFVHGAWTQLSPGSPPAARAAPQMAYDPSESAVILFGGINESGKALADTWRYAGGTWTQLFPSSAPVADAAGMFTYDSTDGYLVLFGGSNNTAAFGFTWRYHAGTWSELFPATSPSARFFPAGADAPLFGGALLFSGINVSSGLASDLWEFRGGGWTEVATSTPLGVRADGSLCSNGGALIYFGGSDGTRARLVSETWGYATPLTFNLSTSPSPTDVGVAVAFNSGASGGIAPYTTTWLYGDGTPNATLSSHVYAQPGNYSIHGSMNDSVGEVAMASGNVTVMALPTVQLAATYHGHSSPLTNVSLSFTSTVRLGVPPYRYSWSYSDGTISTRPDSNHSFADPGPASVRLTVTDAVGGVGIATLNFNVSSPTSGSSSLLVPLVIVGVVVAVILVAVAAIVILRRRRRPVAPWHSEPAMPPLAPPPPPPSA
jgi:hypothetical protein